MQIANSWLYLHRKSTKILLACSVTEVEKKIEKVSSYQQISAKVNTKNC